MELSLQDQENGVKSIRWIWVSYQTAKASNKRRKTRANLDPKCRDRMKDESCTGDRSWQGKYITKAMKNLSCHGLLVTRWDHNESWWICHVWDHHKEGGFEFNWNHQLQGYESDEHQYNDRLITND